jgi:RNA polymerase sigma-70 factor (ECF subfamily)
MEDGRELIARIADGDRDALASFFRQYADRVYRYALTLVRDRALAEEVVQETMLAVWKGAGTFRGGGKLSTWVLGIARHKGLDKLRQERQSAKLETKHDEPDTVIEPEREAARELLQDRVRAALEKLPAEHRETIILAFYHGLSYREIAELMECPEGTVKSRIFYAKEQMKRILKEER